MVRTPRAVHQPHTQYILYSYCYILCIHIIIVIMTGYSVTGKSFSIGNGRVYQLLECLIDRRNKSSVGTDRKKINLII